MLEIILSIVITAIAIGTAIGFAIRADKLTKKTTDGNLISTLKLKALRDDTDQKRRSVLHAEIEQGDGGKWRFQIFQRGEFVGLSRPYGYIEKSDCIDALEEIYGDIKYEVKT